MSERTGIFAGENPFEIARRWLAEISATETVDPNAIALATVDQNGMPNVRMVLLKDITDAGFVFYTNYEGKKAQELESAGKGAFVLHSKSMGRQIRVRGEIHRTDAATSDAYFASRSLQSRLGAWASAQSQPLESRASLMAKVAKLTIEKGPNPPRPPFWGGYEIRPTEFELSLIHI